MLTEGEHGFVHEEVKKEVEGRQASKASERASKQEGIAGRQVTERNVGNRGRGAKSERTLRKQLWRRLQRGTEHRAGLGWLAGWLAVGQQRYLSSKARQGLLALLKSALIISFIFVENDPKKLPAPALMLSARHDRAGRRFMPSVRIDEPLSTSLHIIAGTLFSISSTI
ncbi:hypothetical protein T05_6521 [Trichinella murrelli]|uniref:Uncharacterized protein n=1 Tax=Trichinella murrelli TaxID=144512 RepID=A0A0V0TE52_9BILA|nr:hypothetical protein T05_6521 [Trichinella murrelli]